MGSITVTNLSKAYKQYPARKGRLAEWLLPGNKKRHTLHWVLQDINSTVDPGEADGIIGAGKSTLLKISIGSTIPNNRGAPHASTKSINLIVVIPLKPYNLYLTLPLAPFILGYNINSVRLNSL